MIEKKKLSATEVLLFFSKPLPLTGTLYFAHTSSDNELPTALDIDTNLAKTVLLTADFTYLKSHTPEQLEDLEALFLAELEDFAETNSTPLTAPHQNTDAKIKIILKTIIAPYLQKDGGDIEFIARQNADVQVRFLGKCHGCPYAQQTLTQRVEKNLIRYLPEIRKVILI